MTDNTDKFFFYKLSSPDFIYEPLVIISVLNNTTFWFSEIYCFIPEGFHRNIENDNSYNEQITVEDDGFEMYLRFGIGFPTGQLRETKFQPEYVAEEIYEEFITLKVDLYRGLTFDEEEIKLL
ncbi:MAG: hypothetical protein IID03_11265 [Candidatus Dadabacteria bacterium]|nr:hypothetical protein [Candidatus Dadabacteria bacterium]